MEKHIELDSISQIIEKKCTDVKMYIQSAIAKVLLDNKNILPQLEDLECIINTTFSDFFGMIGYKTASPVNITSGIDKSVYLIGAPISVLKPYIINENIPSEGLYLIQHCIRTHNLKYMYDSHIPRWKSTFPGWCCLVGPDKGVKLLEHVIVFLQEVIGIRSDQLVIRVNILDNDLINFIKKSSFKGNIEYNTKPDIYYTHQYGLGDVVGRNFNFAINNGKGINDIGNFISIESKNKKYGYEFAMGGTTLISEVLDLGNTIDTSVISKELGSDNLSCIKFKDCIETSVKLIQEGLKMSSSNNKGRILRDYIRGIVYHKSLLKLSNDDVDILINSLLSNASKEMANNVSTTLKNYINNIELKIKNTTDNKLSKEEKIIKDVLLNK